MMIMMMLQKPNRISRHKSTKFSFQPKHSNFLPPVPTRPLLKYPRILKLYISKHWKNKKLCPGALICCFN